MDAGAAGGTGPPPDLNSWHSTLLFGSFLLSWSRTMLLLTRTQPTPYWRTLLVLGRVSNLPTVWSNCLAGWLLGGGGRWALLAWACVGTSLLYVAGMFLNDAFDFNFDRQHRSN